MCTCSEAVGITAVCTSLLDAAFSGVLNDFNVRFVVYFVMFFFYGYIPTTQEYV